MPTPPELVELSSSKILEEILGCPAKDSDRESAIEAIATSESICPANKVILALIVDGFYISTEVYKISILSTDNILSLTPVSATIKFTYKDCSPRSLYHAIEHNQMNLHGNNDIEPFISQKDTEGLIFTLSGPSAQKLLDKYGKIVVKEEVFRWQIIQPAFSGGPRPVQIIPGNQGHVPLSHFKHDVLPFHVTAHDFVHLYFIHRENTRVPANRQGYYKRLLTKVKILAFHPLINKSISISPIMWLLGDAFILIPEKSTAKDGYGIQDILYLFNQVFVGPIGNKRKIKYFLFEKAINQNHFAPEMWLIIISTWLEFDELFTNTALACEAKSKYPVFKKKPIFNATIASWPYEVAKLLRQFSKAECEQNAVTVIATLIIAQEIWRANTGYSCVRAVYNQLRRLVLQPRFARSRNYVITAEPQGANITSFVSNGIFKVPVLGATQPPACSN